MFFYMMDKKVKILILVSVVLVILLGIYLLLNIEDKQEEPINTGITIVDNTQKPTELTPPTVTDEREDQNAVLKKYQMIITKVIDKGNSIDYLTTVGVGEVQKETQVTANQNTIFYDAINKLTGGPNLVLEGSEIVFIGKGTPEIKDLSAEIIIVGANPNIKYANIKSINIDGDTGGYIFELGMNNEYLAIEKDMILRNAVAGTIVADTRSIKEGASIVYNVKPEFTQESFGLLYEAEEVILVRNP